MNIFPKLEGLNENTIFIKKIFRLKKDRDIIPHGHSNISSAHLILTGEMHLWHYEKNKQEAKSLIIKPTVDKVIKAKESPSISEELDNIQWFVANTSTAFTFHVIVLDLMGKKYNIHNNDIYNKQVLTYVPCVIHYWIWKMLLKNTERKCITKRQIRFSTNLRVVFTCQNAEMMGIRQSR